MLTFPPHTQYQVCFTPQDNCTKLIANLIYSAKHSVRMQAYSFTSYKIAHALKYDYQHGVDVEVIVDKSNFEPGVYSKAPYLLRNKVPMWVDSELRIAHNKVLIVDGKTVETGSFNYTVGAQYHNAENVLIIHAPTLAQAYLKNWKLRQERSQRITHPVSFPAPTH